MQFKFNQQWSRLKAYANGKHIQIVGDIPIYVSPDGADVWAHPELFQLDAHNAPTAIAGCPPDAFAEDGQPGGIPCTTGISTAPRTTHGGSAGCGTASSSTTWCVLTTSGL